MSFTQSCIYSSVHLTKGILTYLTLASLVAQTVKHLPTMWEIWVRCRGQEDPLEKWQPTPVLLPGKSHGLRSLVGYSPWGHKESDTTSLSHSYLIYFCFYIFCLQRQILKILLCFMLKSLLPIFSSRSLMI